MRQLSSRLGGNHTLLMIVGCVAPMALVTAIFVFNVPLGTVGLFALMLMCPLVHMFMMRGMGHGDQHQQAGCHNVTQADRAEGDADAAPQLASTRKE